jgi:hypothetical protein
MPEPARRVTAVGQKQPRERRRPCAPRGQSRSSGTVPGAPDRRDRRVAVGVARLEAVRIANAVVLFLDDPGCDSRASRLVVRGRDRATSTRSYSSMVTARAVRADVGHKRARLRLVGSAQRCA